MRNILTLSLLLILLPGSVNANVLVEALTKRKNAQAEADINRKRELFSLYTACSSVGLDVGDLPKEGAEAVNLTKKAVINLAESKLRSAHIYTSKEPYTAILEVNINIVGLSFGYTVGLYKGLSDPVSNHFDWANTWMVGYTGTHGLSVSGGDYILSLLSKSLDKFIVEYLRVNEKDCK